MNIEASSRGLNSRTNSCVRQTKSSSVSEALALTFKNQPPNIFDIDAAE